MLFVLHVVILCFVYILRLQLLEEVDGLLEEIHHSDIHHCGPAQNELNESDIKVHYDDAVIVTHAELAIFHLECLLLNLRGSFMA